MKKSLIYIYMSVVPLLFGLKKRRKPTPAQLYRSDFTSSTQRLGLHFPDSLRQKLRFHWLKLKK